MRNWLMVGVCAMVALFNACQSMPSAAGPNPKPKPKPVPKLPPSQLSAAVDKARQQLQDLNATDIALTAKLIEQQNLLLSLPQDSPPTREITRQLAISNKRAQTLAAEVFGAELALEEAIEAEENAAINTVTNSIPTTVVTNTPPATSTPVAEKGALKLRSFMLDSSSGAGTKFVIGELENSGTNPVLNVRVVFEMFDATDGSVGTVSDFIASFAPGAKWSFKALVTDKAAVRVEFKDINTDVPTGLPALPGTNPLPIPVPPPATPPVPPPLP